jgi:protein TonB
MTSEFDGLLDEVLRGMTQAEAPEGLAARVSVRMSTRTESIVAMPVFGMAAQEVGVLGSLWRGLCDAVRPQRLPPLVLESRPVVVANPMAEEIGYRGRAWALALHAAAILLIGVIVRAQVGLAPVSIKDALELAALPKMTPKLQGIGGGGGQHGPTPVTRGTPPKFADVQVVPPKAPPMVAPKIQIEPTIEVQQDLKMASHLPEIGSANSPLVGASLGNGRGTGLGPGIGSGLGPGSGGNTGGSVRQVGGGVSSPVVIYQVDPEFSEEARRAKAEGSVTVDLLVDEHGIPSHVHVVQGIGMGLNEKAVAAVQQYRFKPAMENGKPVTVEMNVEVVFHIY